jgi:uncharacterized protein (UPF0332 family)
LKHKSIVWCLKQKKGIRIIQPSENLTKAYLRKAISALNTMNAALKIKETDWITTTAYYARYFALYALLMRIGVKSEIHDCTIAIAEMLSDERIIKDDQVRDISESKQIRVDTQYYVERELDQVAIGKDVENAREFVLEIEKVIENITTDKIESVRAKIRSLQNR